MFSIHWSIHTVNSS